MAHVHGGLVNVTSSSHITAAVQAIFHCVRTQEIICDDERHRKACRSLLQCLPCSLYRVYDAIRKNGLGNPASLVAKWDGISRNMSDDMKGSPLQVITVFIDLLIYQQCQRNPEFNMTDMVQHPLSLIWKNHLKTKVTCSSCGDSNQMMNVDVVHLSGNEIDVNSAIFQELMRSRVGECREAECSSREPTNIEIVEVQVAESLVVQFKRCSETFTLPMKLDLQGNVLGLKSIIMQSNNKPCLFFGICPDGLFRRFEDTKISTISPGKLCSAGFFQQSVVTLIFEGKKKEPIRAEVPQAENTNLRKKSTDRIKVTGLPDISALNISASGEDHLDDPDDPQAPEQPQTPQQPEQPQDLVNLGDPEQPGDAHSNFEDQNSVAEEQVQNNFVDVGTQTCVMVQDVAIQSPPFACWELCKYSPKFKFNTGLSTEDFLVLFNLIGGHKVIRKLKIHYAMEAPTKLRETKLSCEDKLYMFLLRLRRGLPLEELSDIFKISPQMVGELCYVMTRLIYLTFKSMEDELFISAEDQKKFKPKKMEPFENLRVLMDGASFHTQSPSNFEQQGNTYSKYKRGPVLIFTIGIACNGATIFCSPGMEGRMSDKEVVLKSGLLQKLDKGDSVMTDKGYELAAEMLDIGCKLYKPPLKKDGGFNEEEEILTRAIATTRIYTEHAIAEIKDNRLIQDTIPITLLPVIDNLVYIAAYLRNFSPSRIRDIKVIVED